MSYGIFLLCMSTHACPSKIWSIPMNGRFDLSTISTTYPSLLDFSVFSRVTATLTLSPWSAPPIFDALT